MVFLQRAGMLAAVAAMLSGFGCTPAPSYSERTYRMGECIQLGKLTYHVYGSQWQTHLGEGAGARVPAERFFLVRVSVANEGNAELMVPSMSVVADGGNACPELTDGEHVPEWIGYLRRVKPGTSLAGNVVFDCTPRQYQLRLSDESEQRTALVDIPLTFGAETPEIALPQLPEKQ